MEKTKMFNLQLFGGEGATAGATGDGGNTGDGLSGDNNAVVAEQQRLLELGVPQSKIRKRAKTNVALPTKTESKQPEQRAADAENPTDEVKTEKTRLSWDEIKADPEYNKEIQSIIQSRLKNVKASEDTLAKLTPAIEVLARKYDLDIENPDYDELAKKINDDNDYYENKALEMGVPLETAKRIDQEEREAARLKREETQTLEQQKIQNHLSKLEQQGEVLKNTFPNFDLRNELQNPVFARMTSPNVGLSVEDAYYAVHRNEIQTAAMQVTAQKTAQKIANSIQAGQRRPSENGISTQAPSVNVFDYRNASREQRESLKREIRMAAARGEKVYPVSR